MVSVAVSDNIKQFTKKLNFIQRSQIPFATSRALNDTAVKGQEAVVKGVLIRFDNKKKWWIKGNRRTGIRVDFSNKKKMPLQSAVYTNAYFAEIQEDGGIKAPRSGRALAIPTDRANKSLRRSDGVQKAKARSSVFIDKRGVMQRLSKNRVKTLFTWARTANVTPRFKFNATMNVAVKRWFPIMFKKRLDQAIKSAKL